MLTRKSILNRVRGDQLFHHRLRPRWGAGLLLKEGDGRRVLQFQDGSVRRIKKGWYHLLDAAEAPEGLVTELTQLHNESFTLKPAPVRLPPVPFEAQLRVWRDSYPKGFRDEAYVAEWREGARGRRRLRDPALAAAVEHFAEDHLRELLEEGDFTQMVTEMEAVFDKTSLASPSRILAPLKALGSESHPILAPALFELLWGEAELEDRLDQWISALTKVGLEPSWSLITLPLALVFPQEHVVVRAGRLDLQAREIAPARRVSRQPDARAYASALHVAGEVRERLHAAGLHPRDLLDVEIFVHETLRPQAIDRLEEMDQPQAVAG